MSPSLILLTGVRPTDHAWHLPAENLSFFLLLLLFCPFNPTIIHFPVEEVNFFKKGKKTEILSSIPYPRSLILVFEVRL